MATLQALLPPADGVLYLIGDSTVKGKRGRKYPYSPVGVRLRRLRGWQQIFLGTLQRREREEELATVERLLSRAAGGPGYGW